jgi:hypothetical protein
MKMAVLGNYEMTAITTNSEEDGGRSQPLASEDIKISQSAQNTHFTSCQHMYTVN